MIKTTTFLFFLSIFWSISAFTMDIKPFALNGNDMKKTVREYLWYYGLEIEQSTAGKSQNTNAEKLDEELAIPLFDLN